MSTYSFLFELGCSELPPTALTHIANSFQSNVEVQLSEHRISHQTIELFYTPRRIAILIHELAKEPTAHKVEKRGPALDRAFDDSGQPTPAALGFAKSCGVEFDKLDRLKTDKGEWLHYSAMETGQATEALLPSIIDQAIQKLPIPKMMRWGSNDFTFIRPVEWIVALLDKSVLPLKLFNLNSDRLTLGHRFHAPKPIKIKHAKDYAIELEKRGYVIASYFDRREKITAELNAIASEKQASLDLNESLLDEVTNLVEWPVSLIGSFSEEFLDVPPECIISVLKAHQRYFHLFNEHGKLLPNFITVSNLASKQPEKIINGNERVMQARLSDAQFFFNDDQKHSLNEWREKLKTIIFQDKLGSVFDKTERIAKISAILANNIGADESQTMKAAQLCKSDLVSGMVEEFPELQGIMGSYYGAMHDDTRDFAASLQEHYLPRHASDNLPKTNIGSCLALADRFDTLAAIFAIGKLPTGDKDPFALRRSAIGIIRIITENQITLNIDNVIAACIELLPVELQSDTLKKAVHDFIIERVGNWYRKQGFDEHAIRATLASQHNDLLDFSNRLLAVKKFCAAPEASALASGNKRVKNILKKNPNASASVDENLLKEAAEKALFMAIQDVAPTISELASKYDYNTLLTTLAGLKTPIDDFFEHVMVMCEDKPTQQNRLAILKQLRELFLTIADFSELDIA